MQIYMTRETEDQLRKLAKDSGKTMSEIIRELVKAESKRGGE